VDHGVKNPGLFFTTVAVVLILGRTLGGRFLDLYNREKVIVPCLVAYIVSMAVLAFSETLYFYFFVAEKRRSVDGHGQ
jgi:MFS family permease